MFHASARCRRGRNRWFAAPKISPRASDGSQGRGERTGSGERGAAHRTAVESSGDGGGFAEFRRANPSVWGDLSRGKRTREERRSWGRRGEWRGVTGRGLRE
jgi:hypothetical protein